MADLINGLGGPSGFGTDYLARNDDGSTAAIDLTTIFAHGLNFYGHTYTTLYLNNNGSVTFGTSLGTYTPTSITGNTSVPIIAPLWADVDTRTDSSTPANGPGVVSPTQGGTSTGSDLLWYHLDAATHSFVATWDDVGYYSRHTDKLNAFQLQIVNTDPTGSSGNFAIVFRYESINWVTGDASNGNGGFGGYSAHAGYSAGDGVHYYELSQSGNDSALVSLPGASNVNIPGAYVFQVTNGVVANTYHPGYDFNNDGHSDLLWRNDAGTIVDWMMNGPQLVDGGTVAALDSSWSIRGTGDFNADGRSDLLLQNAGGAIVQWQMSGSQIVGGGLVATLDSSWSIRGTGDFNADGRADILLQNAGGAIVQWQMNGSQVIGGGLVATLDSSWGIRGTGDFNGDGRADILLQNANGAIVQWQMNGSQVIGGGLVATLDSSWSIKGTGDFNGDGRADILLQNANGAIVEWQMNGSQVAGGGVVAALDASWKIEKVGDYNGDGKSDILLHNTNGQVVVWEMNGTQIIGGGAVATVNGDWHLQ